MAFALPPTLKLFPRMGILFCGTHLSFGFFGTGPVRLLCVRRCLLPLPLGILEGRRYLFLDFLPQMKQNRAVTSNGSAKLNWMQGRAITFSTNKWEGLLGSRTDQELGSSVPDTTLTHVPLSNYGLQGNLFWSCCCCVPPSASSSSQKPFTYIML